MKRTTTGKVFRSIYIVGIGASGLVALVIDLGDIFWSTVPSHDWPFSNLRYWLPLAFFGGLLASPLVLVFSLLLAFVNNLFARDEDADDTDNAA